MNLRIFLSYLAGIMLFLAAPIGRCAEGDGYGPGWARDSLTDYFGKGFDRFRSDGLPSECLGALREMDRPLGRRGDEPKPVRFATDSGADSPVRWSSPQVGLAAAIAGFRQEREGFELLPFLNERAVAKFKPHPDGRGQISAAGIQRLLGRLQDLHVHGGQSRALQLAKGAYLVPGPRFIFDAPTSEEELVILNQVVIPISLQAFDEGASVSGPPEYYLSGLKNRQLLTQVVSQLSRPLIWVQFVAECIAEEFWR